MVVDQCGPDAGDLVRAPRCADAAATDRHATIHRTRRDRAGERDHEIRVAVVDADHVGPEVDDLVPRRAELGDQLFLERVLAVVGRDADAHAVA
jgi:hypothetical protein